MANPLISTVLNNILVKEAKKASLSNNCPKVKLDYNQEKALKSIFLNYDISTKEERITNVDNFPYKHSSTQSLSKNNQDRSIKNLYSLDEYVGK